MVISVQDPLGLPTWELPAPVPFLGLPESAPCWPLRGLPVASLRLSVPSISVGNPQPPGQVLQSPLSKNGVVWAQIPSLQVQSSWCQILSLNSFSLHAWVSWESCKTWQSFCCIQPKSFAVMIPAASLKPLPSLHFCCWLVFGFHFLVNFGFVLTLSTLVPHLEEVGSLLSFTYNGMSERKKYN